MARISCPFPWPRKRWRWSIVSGPFFAIALSLGLTAFFIELGFHKISTAKMNRFLIIVYQPGVTIIATLVTAYIASQLQYLYKRRLTIKLEETHRLPPPDVLDGHYRAILKMPTLADRFRNKQVTILYLISGLITTTLTSILLPAFQHDNYQEVFQIPKYSFDQCISVTENGIASANSDTAWAVNATHSITISQDYRCPYKMSTGLLALINPKLPAEAAYFESGATIWQGAFGAPSILYEKFNGLTVDDSVWDFTIKPCVPILSLNPVSCRENPNVFVDAAGTVTVYAELDGGVNCTSTFNANSDVPDANPPEASQFCYGKEVGKAAMMWTSTGTVAALLSAAIGKNRPASAPGQYSVLCTIDTTTAFNVTQIVIDWFNLLVKGGDPRECSSFSSEPIDISPTLTPALYAAAVSLKELGADTRSWPVRLYEPSNDNTTFIPRNSSTFAFGGGSKNALEDVLGVLVGIAAARMGSFDSNYPENLLRPLSTTVFKTVFVIGSYGYYSVLYSLPILVIAIAIVSLLLSDSMKDTEIDVTSLEQLLRYRGSAGVEHTSVEPKAN